MKFTHQAAMAFANGLVAHHMERVTWCHMSKGGYDLELDQHGKRIYDEARDDESMEQDSAVSDPRKDTLTNCPYPPGSKERIEWLANHYNGKVNPYTGESKPDEVSPFMVDLETELLAMEVIAESECVGHEDYYKFKGMD